MKEIHVFGAEVLLKGAGPDVVNINLVWYADILFVGITYDPAGKTHACRIQKQPL